MIVAFTLYPLEYVRQMLSNRVDNSGVGIWHQFKKTIRKSGIRGVYKGVHIFLSSLVLFRGTYFGLYDSLKIKTQDRQMRWLISYFSMLCSVLAVYPGDTVRRRILSSKEKYSGFKHCFLSIWKK
jgi:solute carrier family 25 (adenine nucleotide translocator) protein 4/5/6/31